MRNALIAVVAGVLLGCPAGEPGSESLPVAPDGGKVTPAPDAGDWQPDGGLDGGFDGGLDGGAEVDCFGGADEGDLPDRVIFRTKTQSFNRKWYAAIHQGRIYVKPNSEAGQTPGPWQLLGTGLPSGAGLSHFPVPTEVVEISGDGTWLHALSDAGVFYRGTDFTQNVLSSFTWSDAWGHPAATGPGMVTEFPTTYGWSVSDSQGPGVNHYEDRLGTVHSVGNGVAHVYRLGPTGRTLIFNDWWLPNDWSRQICLPDRGTFFAENLSTSASTSFIIGTQGAMYTRLYDFDTSGEDDLLTGSFAITHAAGDTRALPAEDWRRQPDITDGLITRKITLFQDGQGNAARVLRVEGVRQGRTGFFQKHLMDDAWSFEETGARVCGPFLNAPGRPAAAPMAPADTQLTGTLSVSRAGGSSVSVEIRLRNFNIFCSPAEAQLFVGGNVVTVHGQPLVLPFHHVHSLTLTPRPTHYWQTGAPAVLRAALLVPATISQIDDAAARQKVMGLVQARKVINFQGTATMSLLNLGEMTWLDPLVGVVPGDEKTDPGNEIKLVATP